MTPKPFAQFRPSLLELEPRDVPTAVPLTTDGSEWVKVDTISIGVKTNRDAASGVHSDVILV